MDSIEERSLHHLNIGLYKRYVDDCFCLTTNEEEARTFLTTMNAQDENISFDIELPENGSLALLDFWSASITVNQATLFTGRLQGPIFMNFKSAIPLNTKENCIRNELKRIDERCSTITNKKVHRREVEEILRLNSYPRNITNLITRKSRRKRKLEKRSEEKKFVYFQFPFINDKVQRKVQMIFKKNGLPVRVYDKTYTLRNALSKREDPLPCNLKNCAVTNKSMCNVKKCVYELRCQECNQCYIGSTLRPLHTRFMEHMKNEKSSVFQHKKNCKAAFSAVIIDKARDNTSLRFKEALHIQKRKPSINAKRESDELISLTFG